MAYVPETAEEKGCKGRHFVKGLATKEESLLCCRDVDDRRL